jgi:hypothetical protein
MLAVVEDGARQPEASRMALPDGMPVPRTDAVKAAAAEPRRRDPGEAGWWLLGAAAVLALLAAAAAAVSWQAQYVMVVGVKNARAIAAIEAGIPDAGALIFAALGVALALHGRRALRPRALNAACIAISLAMNALASGHSWRDLAIWVMPAAIYAVASDTLIGVVRSRAVARQRADNTGSGDDAPDLLATLGSTALWLLRLLLAGPSTLSGFRTWVIEECPVAPGRKAIPEVQSLSAVNAAPALAGHTAQGQQRQRRDGPPTKRDRLVRLAGERRDLACIPLGEVSRLATVLAQEIGYSAGTARRELIRHVRELQAGPSASGQPGRNDVGDD